MKSTIAAMAATTLAANAALINIGDSADGGIDASDVDNWTTNNTVNAGAGTTGLAFEWENVTATTSARDANPANNQFVFTMTSNANHTIGHGYLMNESFDLSTTAAGIESMTINLDMNASANANWRPMLAVTVAGVTNLYSWKSSSNPWSGNDSITVSDGATNAAGSTWGVINASATGIGGTFDAGTSAPLQTTDGVVQFGFFQWGASSRGSASHVDQTLAIDSLNYGITYTVPEPSSTALLGLGGLALILRRRK